MPALRSLAEIIAAAINPPARKPAPKGVSQRQKNGEPIVDEGGAKRVVDEFRLISVTAIANNCELFLNVV
jgi:hypothetical protein